jgi:hypothetical protein
MIATASAIRDDLLASVQGDTLDGDQGSENHRLEGHCQVLVDHREPTGDLLRLGVTVDGRLLDHLLEPPLPDA